MASFIKTTGTKQDSNGNAVCYYYCNRTGYYKQKGTGERLPKTQGTSKLDTYCTASIRTTSNQLIELDRGVQHSL